VLYLKPGHKVRIEQDDSVWELEVEEHNEVQGYVICSARLVSDQTHQGLQSSFAKRGKTIE
jgi:hypothetical protein